MDYIDIEFERFVSVIICQFLFLSAYLCFIHGSRNIVVPWLMMLVVCLTFFWDGDYYHYKMDFMNGLLIVGEKDPVYVWLAEVAHWNYSIWRLYIWGSALLFLYLNCKRLELDKNITIFILAFFACSSFAYSRATLSMAIYFYGISFLVYPIKKRFFSIIIGCFFLFLSYFAHRSVLPLIIISPLALIPLTKSRLIIASFFIPIIVIFINQIFGSFLDGEIQLEDQLSAFQASAERAAGIESGLKKNWRAQLLYDCHIYSLFVPIGFILWKLFFSKERFEVDTFFVKMMTIVVVIVIIGCSILYGLKWGETETIGMRYLNFSIIPEVLLMTYLYQYDFINRKTLYLLLLLGFASIEGQFFSYYLLHSIPI